MANDEQEKVTKVEIKDDKDDDKETTTNPSASMSYTSMSSSKNPMSRSVNSSSISTMSSNNSITLNQNTNKTVLPTRSSITNENLSSSGDFVITPQGKLAKSEDEVPKFTDYSQMTLEKDRDGKYTFHKEGGVLSKSVTVEAHTNIDDLRKFNDGSNEKMTMMHFGRKDNAEDGYAYSIETMANHPETIRIEGYLLFEKKLDLKEYVERVNKFYDAVEKQTKEMVTAEAEAEESSGAGSNSTTFETGSEAEKNNETLIQSLEPAAIIKDKSEELFDRLSLQDQMVFTNFNKNLEILKTGTRLKMLIERSKELNNANTILQGPDKHYYPLKKETFIPRVEERIDDVRVKLIERSIVQTCRNNNDLQEFLEKVTIYRNIRLDDIMKTVSWENRDLFEKQLTIMERRFKEANIENERPYCNKPGVILHVE